MKRIFVKFLLVLLATSLLIPQIIVIKSESDKLPNYDNNIAKSVGKKILETDRTNDLISIPEILRIADQYPPAILGLDPHIDFHPRLVSLSFDGLVDVDLDSGSIIPGLAYQWVVTNDSKEWTFYLRNDVLFHDNSKFNATAVKFSIDRLFNPNNPLYAEGSWVSLDADIPLNSLEIINEFEIKFIFSEPYAPLIQRLPIITILSPNSFIGSNFSIPIGTGPYMLDLNSSIVSFNETFYNFTIFPTYFQGLAPFKNIYYQSFSGQHSKFEEAITSKQVDMISTNDAEFISELLISELLEPSPYWNITSLNNLARHDLGWFNHNHYILSDSDVRKAINHAIDKEAYINEVRGGLAKLIKSIIPANVPYHNSEVTGYDYNITKAKILLDEANYVIDEDGWRFTLNVVTFHGGHDRGMFVCNSLEAINIKCNFRTEQGFFPLEEGDFDIYVVGYQHVLDPSISFDLLNTNGVNNYGSYSNSAIDILTELARQTPVHQEQEFYYGLIQSVAQEESPYILLADLPLTFIRMRNITSHVGIDFFSQIDFNFQSENQFITSAEESAFLKSKNSYKLKLNQEVSSDINFIENVKVSSIPLYLPFTDSILSSQEQDILATVKMTHQFQNFVNTQQGKGKFFEINIDKSSQEFIFRAYYDMDEIHSISPDQLSLFKWDLSKETWVEMSSISSNTSLRYIEVNMVGNAYLKFGEKLEMNNSFFPPIITFSALILMVGVASFAFWAIRKNIKFFKGLRDRYGL
jgi:peptide/nickel transport system substrate-binding protein